MTGHAQAAVLALVAGIGLLIGSFLNVVIWRVPRGESVVAPPSACPRCAHPIRRRDNVPVLSWLALRGSCRDCHERIPVRYPLVELVTGVAFVVVAVRFGLGTDNGWAVPAYLYLAAIGVALTLIDLDTRRLPNAIVLPSYLVGPVLLAVASWGIQDWGALMRAVAAGAVLYVFYFVLMVVYPVGMGFGDVKLAGVLGLYLGWIGWGAFVVGAFAAFLLGGAFAVGLLASGRAGRKSGIPFGPWMVGGAAVGVVCGEQLWSGYIGLMS
ncbi:prepilin peptidase [Actinotalea sp. K2]|nr:prepilin peptidase [Actinotalea sp. K2]